MIAHESLRLRPAYALAAVGVLAGLVVAAWGSLFAVHALYPSYVSAFTTPKVEETAAAPAEADMDLAARTELVLSGLKLDEGAAPAASEPVEPELAALPAPEPAPLPTEEAAPAEPERPEVQNVAEAPVEETPQAPTPRALARLSEEDLATRAAAALFFGAPEEVAEAPEAELVSPTTLAAAQSLRPRPRPEDVEPMPAPETIELAVAEAVDTDTPMASTLAVETSPRPRGLPRALRAAFTPRRNAAPAPQQNAEPAPQAQSTPMIAGRGCGRNHARDMPNRPASAPGGTTFISSLGNGSGGSRDNAIINELARGNMPGFLKDLQSVVIRGQDARGADTEIVICVTPDYLALGSDSDFVRVPLGLPAAASIAKRFGMTLPTSRMVDAVYAQANVKLSPKPMQAGPQMSSTNYFLRHNATIEGQRQGRRGLISGHKKDVVIASRMASNPGRVAIYGWHRSRGNPIQPVSTVHGASYADYSHGIRLVSKTAYLNGRAVSLDELLSSRRYAYLLNSDGPLPGQVIRIASR